MGKKNRLKFSSLARRSPENEQAKGISDKKKNKKNRRNSLSNFELLRLVFVLGSFHAGELITGWPRGVKP